MRYFLQDRIWAVAAGLGLAAAALALLGPQGLWAVLTFVLAAALISRFIAFRDPVSPLPAKAPEDPAAAIMSPLVRQIVAQLPAPVLLLDERGRIFFVNDPMIAVIGPGAERKPISSVLREPVVRVAHWMRSFQATSVSGQYAIDMDLNVLGQRQLYAGSVFGYFRPGYVPPNTVFSADGTTVPVMQIVSESTTAQWVNLAERMAGNGLGWSGTQSDVVAQIQPLADLIGTGQVSAAIDRLNLLLYAGRMSSTLKQDLMDAIVSVSGADASSNLNRARVALLLALASPEYMVQR